MMSKTEELRLIDESLQEFGINLSISYAKMYKSDPKGFMTAFFKLKSVRMASWFICSAYRKSGLIDTMEQKDFTEYIGRHYTGNRWFNTINTFLMIMYNLLKEDSQQEQINYLENK